MESEISKKYPGSIYVIWQNLSEELRLTLWSVCKYQIITTLADGQCIPPLEFLAVKEIYKDFKKSAIIISERSGNSRALGGVIKVNPTNYDELVRAMDKAIQMKD